MGIANSTLGRGKKTKAWDKARARLKAKLLKLGITSCELRRPLCKRDFAMGFAHAKKRRNLREDELGDAVLACCSCHAEIELLPEAEMEKIVRETINAREDSVIHHTVD